MKKVCLIFVIVSMLFCTNFQIFEFAATEIKAQNPPQAKLFLSPSAGSFLVGSTLDVSIVVDTGGAAINTVKVDLKFTPDMLQVVSPSSGKSFVSLWLDQPNYSNRDGTIHFIGSTPEGITTSNGIVSTITFRVIKLGEANIKILSSSSVLAHDGKGTQLLSKTIDAWYTLVPKPSSGPNVFSQTHPDETLWYNNNNSIISWEREQGVSDFSFVLDNFHKTVPDNISDSKETTQAYENLADGLWYFHIKSEKGGVWGMPSHFLLRIDVTPPVAFKPKVEFLLAAIIGRALVSFSTIDALSGFDHYEVAVIDKTEPPLNSPLFIEAQSPYQLPNPFSGHLLVVVRAIDKSGNVREESIDANFPEPIISMVKNNIIIILSGALALACFYIFIHFLLRHRGM